MGIPVIEMMEKRGPTMSFERLMGYHDLLKGAGDSRIRYIGAWACIYASMKGVDFHDREEARLTAAVELAELSVNPQSTWPNEDDECISMHAELSLATLGQISNHSTKWEQSERRLVLQKLIGVSSRLCNLASKEDSSYGTGLLTECVVMMLGWRPLGEPAAHITGNQELNIVPAGPVKDARRPDRNQWNTDLYSFRPNGGYDSRVGIQVKTTTTQADIKRYKTVLVGANTHFAHPAQDKVSGKAKSLYLAKYLQKEANGDKLTDPDLQALHSSQAHVYQAITEREIAKKAQQHKRIARSEINWWHQHLQQEADETAEWEKSLQKETANAPVE